MYKEIETPAIAKKRYYFKKGYRQVTIAQKDEVRRILMSALNITRYTYFRICLIMALWIFPCQSMKLSRLFFKNTE